MIYRKDTEEVKQNKKEKKQPARLPCLSKI